MTKRPLRLFIPESGVSRFHYAHGDFGRSCQSGTHRWLLFSQPYVGTHWTPLGCLRPPACNEHNRLTLTIDITSQGQDTHSSRNMGGRKKKGPQPDFVFLSYAPNRTETDQVAQESQRRAHAARKSHAAARQRRYDDIRSSIASSVVKQPSNSLGESTSASESPEEYSGEDEAVSSSLMYKDENASHVTKDDNNRVHQMFYHTSRPMKFLGQGHIDPFDTFASKGLPAYVYEVLHIGKWSL